MLDPNSTLESSLLLACLGEHPSYCKSSMTSDIQEWRLFALRRKSVWCGCSAFLDHGRGNFRNPRRHWGGGDADAEQVKSWGEGRLLTVCQDPGWRTRCPRLLLRRWRHQSPFRSVQESGGCGRRDRLQGYWVCQDLGREDWGWICRRQASHTCLLWEQNPHRVWR